MSTFIRILVLTVVFATACCPGQEPKSDSRDDAQEMEAVTKFRAYAKEVANAYVLRTGDGGKRKLTLIAEPVLRWTNPLGGQRARGEIFLWTDAGLPAAIVSINEFTDAAGRFRGTAPAANARHGRTLCRRKDNAQWSHTNAAVAAQTDLSL